MAAVTYSMYKGERHCHTCLTHVPPFSGSATLLLVFLLFLSRVLHQYFICFQPLSVTLIMTRAKHCSQSPTGAHCPKCRKEGLYLCPSCLDSLAVYRLTRNFKAIKKKFHEFELKRDAAMPYLLYMPSYIRREKHEYRVMFFFVCGNFLVNCLVNPFLLPVDVS